MTSPQKNSGERYTFGPVPPEDAGLRLDVWLTNIHRELSRARWQDLIKSGCVRIDDQTRKPNYSVQKGETVIAVIPPPENIELVPEDIPLNVLFEDEFLIVINKPPQLVVHPAPGHDSGTLVNALLHHCKDLAGIGGELRPGIVHRLDQDTSGVIVVAKNDEAMQHLAAQFKDRKTSKEYAALVWGTPSPAAGTIRTTIGRDPHNRQKMSTRSTSGRDAVSRYEVTETLGPVSLVKVTIETGRTHQIRVHMAHIKHPIVGDAVYGKRREAELPLTPERQMLHARKLSFTHPKTGETMRYEAPLPDDFAAMVEACRNIE